MKRGSNQIRQAGFNLIELMVAMVLGLLVIGAAFGIFLSNQRGFQASQGLGRIQESTQVAFEMLARDLREAGGSPCDATATAGNIVTNAATVWYANWNRPLFGYDGSGLTGQVTGTDAIQLVRTGDSVQTTTATGLNSFSYTPNQTYAAGNVMMVCDGRVFGIFRAASPTASSVAIASSPANGCNYLPVPNAGICAGGAAQYTFPKFAAISRMLGVRWFVGAPTGDAIGNALYRQTDDGNPEEIVQGVQDMEVEYLGDAGYVAASGLADDVAWGNVRAVRVTLTLQEAEQSSASTDGQPLQRTVTQTIALRNRNL